MPNAMSSNSFCSNLHYLVALISYLGCTDYKSRRAKVLAQDLGLEPDKVLQTLESELGQRVKEISRQSRITLIAAVLAALAAIAAATISSLAKT